MESIREYFWTYYKHAIPVDRIVSYLSVDHHHADNLSFKNQFSLLLLLPLSNCCITT